MESIESQFQENIWCQIKLKDNDKLLAGRIYRSPNSTREEFLKLSKLLKDVIEMRKSHTLIVGGFNFKEIKWKNYKTSVSEEHLASVFLESIRDTFLFQHVLEPTRFA